MQVGARAQFGFAASPAAGATRVNKVLEVEAEIVAQAEAEPVGGEVRPQRLESGRGAIPNTWVSSSASGASLAPPVSKLARTRE